MIHFQIYLTFNGDCEAAFEFYRSIFGGEYASFRRFKEMPPSDDYPPVPEDQQDRLMHVSLPISEHTVLMGSDTADPWAAHFQRGNNFSISVRTDDQQDADRLHAKLSGGGRVTMPMQQTFWGDYFGSCEDRFGVNWMVACQPK